MRKKLINLLALLVFLSVLTSVNGVSASDMLISNYSFESGTTGWTQSYGSGGITVSSEQKHTGGYSLKINDTSSTASFGMESTKLSAAAGTAYSASAKVYIVSGWADLYIRFWSSSNTLISSAFKETSGPAGQWKDLSVTGTAPAGTAYVSVMLYGNTSSTGVCYYDDIGITTQFTTIGPQVTNSTIRGAAFGKDENNNDVMYTVSDGATGYVPKLYQINVNTLAVQRSIELPGATGAWAVTVATDGKAYAGSYANGHLYQYTPGSGSVTDLGGAGGDSFIWDLQPGWDGKVYGGTYHHAYVFKYDNGAFSIFGPNGVGQPFDTAENYVRSVAYDPENHVLYVGIGSHAKLYRYDCYTGQCDNILPAEYADCEFIYNLSYIDGKVFAKVTPGNTTLVLNVAKDENNVVTTTVDCVIDGLTNLCVSPSLNGKVYYSNYGNLYCYDIANKTYGPILDNQGKNIYMTINPCEMAILQLSDQTNYPGYSLVGTGITAGETRLFKYNITTGTSSLNTLELSGTPSNIQSITTGPDGKIYSSGFLNGGTAVYTPMRSDLNVQYKGIGQCESMTTVGNKLYFGVYTGAYIYEYDPFQGWNGYNPTRLFTLSGHEQDRPVSMTGGDNKLFIGTVPNYGKLGGALTIYDTSSGGDPTVLRNIVQDQSVVSLAYKDGIIYGGTAIYGGMGSTPTQTTAKFFAYRVSDGTKLFEIAPISGKKAITSLTVGPDGKIWGMDEGYLFIYNPSTGTIEYCQEKFPGISYPSDGIVYSDAALLVGKDGNVYGTIAGRLFKIDVTTKTVTTLLSSGASRLTQDSAGFLYYINGTDLKRYSF